MTKARAPITFENALTKIAGRIGWAEVARICGVKERAARNWSEPDTLSSLRLAQALALDIAFLAAGGDHAPMLLVFATRVNVGLIESTADRHALIVGAARAARESGEAVAATLTASRPDATLAEIVIAEREIEQSIEAKTGLLSLFRGLRAAITRTRGSGDQLERGPEVPPPTVSA